MKISRNLRLRANRLFGQTAILASVFGLWACGSGEPQYVQGFDYNIQNEVVSMNLEFNKQMSLNTSFSIPILNYGSINLLAGNGTYGFAIGGTLNVPAISDQKTVTLEKTTNMPNGAPFYSYISTPMARIRIDAGNNNAVNLYIGLEPDHYYFGIAVELSFMGAEFPSGLVFSQVINDSLSRTLGVVSIFGPNVQNGSVVANGGFFVATNISDLAKYIQDGINGNQQQKKMALVGPDGMITPPLKPADNTNSNIQKYADKGEQLKLYNLFMEKAKAAGASK